MIPTVPGYDQQLILGSLGNALTNYRLSIHLTVMNVTSETVVPIRPYMDRRDAELRAQAIEENRAKIREAQELGIYAIEAIFELHALMEDPSQDVRESTLNVLRSIKSTLGARLGFGAVAVSEAQAAQVIPFS